MDARRRAVVGGAFAVGLFVLVQVGALALVEPFQAAGYQQVENPQNPTNSLFYVGLLLVATAGMLVALKYGGDRLLRAFIVFTSGFISWYVFSVLFAPLPAGSFLAVAAAGVVALALYAYPEWYVVDSAGVVMGAGAAALFGISFGVLPAIVLLMVLAVYDAISVYGTEHMLALASGVMAMKVPVILVIPLSWNYSFRDDSPAEEAESDGTNEDEAAAGDADDAASATDDGAGDEDVAESPLAREAFFIGLGDAVMPTILVASAAFFVDAPDLGLPVAANLPAVTAMAGTLTGLVVLLAMVMKGRAHAGLPLLNGGAILGYLAGAVASGIPVVQALGLAPYV
jgi:presenilin-like A22 family membrane protease